MIYPQTTAGISRNMQTDAAPSPQAGGDLNGSAATTILFGQSGTPCVQISLPRQVEGASTIMGVTN